MTKTIIQSAVAVLLVSTIFTGCGGEPKPEFDDRCFQDEVLAPNFTCDPIADGAVVALGVAKMNGGNDKGFQRTEAMASARDSLARQIEVKVSNLFKKYKGTTGSGDAATFDQASSDVSKQLASQTLAGSKQIGRSWRHPKTKELFIMVGISSGDVAGKVGSAIKTSFKNDQAMYQKFLAEKANGDLDKELEKAGMQ